MSKLEEQLAKQNKRFKAVNNEYASIKRNTMNAVQSTSSLSKKGPVKDKVKRGDEEVQSREIVEPPVIIEDKK